MLFEIFNMIGANDEHCVQTTVSPKQTSMLLRGSYRPAKQTFVNLSQQILAVMPLTQWLCTLTAGTLLSP